MKVWFLEYFYMTTQNQSGPGYFSGFYAVVMGAKRMVGSNQVHILDQLEPHRIFKDHTGWIRTSWYTWDQS